MEQKVAFLHVTQNGTFTSNTGREFYV